MPGLRALSRTTVGKVTALTFLLTVAYIGWLLSFDKDPNVERWISAICLNLLHLIFIYFGIHMVKEYPMSPRLQRSWMLLIGATGCLTIGDLIYILSGRPPLSAADIFYIFYYVLYVVGILSFPFVPVSRREKSLLMLDLSIVLTAALVLLWYFLIESVLSYIPLSNKDVLANLGYPLLDFLLVACAVIIIQRDVEGLHPLTLLWIAVAKVFAALADTFLVYGWMQDKKIFLDFSSSAFVFEQFLVLLAIAYQITCLKFPDEFRSSSLAKRILRDALPYIAISVILALLTVGLIRQESLEWKLRGALFGTMALIIMVLYRQYIMLKENLLLYHEARAAREDAEKATKAKAEFLANMSHEIRTPMHGVIGTTELLLNSNLNDQQKNIVETIRSSGDALLHVINDILDFSKIESGRMEIQSQPFDLRRCIQEAFDPIRLEASKKGIQLLSSIASGVPDIIVGDAARVREIILNLLSNAVKFTSQGDVELLARCKNKHGSAFEFEISVRDTGIGIPQELQNTLFQPFSQLDISSSGSHSGTGLGLAISKRLCEMMGGRMWVESSEGNGSTFYFTFVASAQSALYTKSAERDFRIDTKLAERLPLRILVVEDNLVHQKIAVLMLEQMGYHADIASNGIEGLRLFRERNHDLILMDMRMPEMDGLECATQIRLAQIENQKPIIIALSASAVKGDRERCLAAGMNDMLTKPMLVETLQAAILRWWKVDSSPIPLMMHIPPEQRQYVQSQLITAYMHDTPDRLKDLRKAIANADWNSVRQEAHSLKGASQLMGMESVANLCAQLEQITMQEERSLVEALVGSIEQEYQSASMEFVHLLNASPDEESRG